MCGLIRCKLFYRPSRRLLSFRAMLPPFTDLFALLGVDLVLCASCLRLLGSWRPQARWAKPAGVGVYFALLWWPAGTAHLPLLAYVRGISADMSITLVALAGLFIGQRLLGWNAPTRRERMALYGTVAAAALFLYPLALGWSDWDAYRPGWGSWGMWVALLAVSLLCWLKSLRLVPLLIGLALIAWSLGLMESANLWDYLLDPWLALVSVFQCLQWAAQQVLTRFRPENAVAGEGFS